jgi:ATP-dependent DNA helicase RecG
MQIWKKAAVAGLMGMTDRFASRRTFAAHFTTPRHNKTPLRKVKLRAPIVADSPSRKQDGQALQYLKGVGPERAKTLNRMGIRTPIDLLTYFPRDWQDRRHRFSIQDAPVDEKCTLIGKVTWVRHSSLRRDLGMITATLQDESGTLKAVWFKKSNPRYDVFASLLNQLQALPTIMIWGGIEMGIEGRQFRVEEMAVLNPDRTLKPEDALHLNRIVPQYTVPNGLSERLLRSLIARVLPLVSQAPSLIPKWLAEQRQAPEKAWALNTLHFPGTLLEKERAREHLALEEFLLLETALAVLRRSVKQQPKPHAYQITRQFLTPFREQLGFELTDAQKKVIREIFDDLRSPFPMNRLLQGDVGSGKTVVALSAMLLAVENGGQAALMAPTEILAEQHGLTVQRLLKGLPVRWAVLTRNQTPAERKLVRREIEQGNIPLVIGTHAVIQKSVKFKNLMLAVIDEQHRFGVEHRGLLRQKGSHPDVLVMTATPIPRTLALTLYGDLDVSTLDSLPPGRTPITTRQVSEQDAYRTIQQEVAKGHQAYMVFPLVEESDKLELKATVQEAETLSKSVFNNLRVGVLHGQLRPAEKEATMEKFRKGEIDLLMATSIIEVGIDVPNATAIAIQHAERFGLATLHQLRGRVGRSAFASLCLLVADTRSSEAKRRIEVMIQTQNGFRISEEDLALRGPGEILGAMQHGLPPFKVGHLIRDAGLIQAARQSAHELLQQDPELKRPDHAPLRAALQAAYSTKWFLGATG